LCLGRLELLGAPYHGAEDKAPEEVDVDAVAGTPHRWTGVVIVGIQEVHVVALGDIPRTEALAGEFLEQIPDAPGKGARGLGSDVGGDCVGGQPRQQSPQQLEMQSLALEGEFQVFKVTFARRVVAWIGFLRLLRRRMSAARAMADE